MLVECVHLLAQLIINSYFLICVREMSHRAYVFRVLSCLCFSVFVPYLCQLPQNNSPAWVVYRDCVVPCRSYKYCARAMLVSAQPPSHESHLQLKLGPIEANHLMCLSLSQSTPPLSNKQNLRSLTSSNNYRRTSPLKADDSLFFVQFVRRICCFLKGLRLNPA